MIEFQDKKVNVIGAGIIGLMSAYYLNESGFEVSVFDAGPDPLINYDRNKAGTTFSGGDARHVSATETSPHASPAMAGKIYLGVEQGGWLAKDPSKLTDPERAWMAEFDQLTQDPRTFNRNTKTVTRINNYGKDLWRDLRRKYPQLFNGVGFQEPLTVLFLDRDTFESEIAVETRANPSYPVQIFNTGGSELIAGGLILDGFAVNSISLCRNMIRSLQNQGVDFSWNKPVTSLEDIPPVNHYLISTGARPQNFSLRTPSHQKIMGVAGVWIKIPNPGLEGPIKIAAPYPTGYINGTLENQDLVLSGGYGFIGQDELDRQSPQIQYLLEDLSRNVSTLFPESYARALKEGTLDPRACVRPMRANGLWVLNTVKKSGQTVIFAGGNNAGGFTQAPVIATAALDIFNRLSGSFQR